jgi:transposase
LLIELQTWLRGQRARLSSKSETAKAIDYALKRWTALTRFLDDGRLCLSNNAAERALRCVAVGRRNWTFAGSSCSTGRRRAGVMTRNRDQAVGSEAEAETTRTVWNDGWLDRRAGRWAYAG